MCNKYERKELGNRLSRTNVVYLNIDPDNIYLDKPVIRRILYYAENKQIQEERYQENNGWQLSEAHKDDRVFRR